ncbi:hypothetical protein CBS147332_177 [Penicillium roqueforti]|nr:hypothetical protein CBS147332_177 [Penicillium roqueforti]KAI3120987.1 hypothetical protein CBS147331_2206 [Penicillium roqueforti]
MLAVGAAFTLNQANYEGYTDFIASGGPNHYTWNVIRSEADELLFRHAAKSGAKAFDGVKVNSIEFAQPPASNGTAGNESGASALGRPVSASYTLKSEGVSGAVKFDYIIDASGSKGLLSTKYLKNRTFNQGLKNVASWGYWRSTGKYGIGTAREDSPYFEALIDESGWAWFIPLHDNTTSVGVVMNQEIMNKKKAASGLSSRDFYLSSLKLAPHLNEFLSGGELVTGIKSASDFSYSSSSYAFPYARIVGDAGCFIDPYFSSGVHLAITSALSAAVTVSAAIRGDCEEEIAAKWHSNKVKAGYSRWLLVVLSTYKQIGNQKEPVLSEYGEDNFDRAFNFFKPIIQGTADTTNNLTQAEFSKSFHFCVKAFDRYKNKTDSEEPTSKEEEKMLAEFRSTQAKTWNGIDSFTTDDIDGRVPRLERGNLGLMSVIVAAP